ncbi:putative condensin subunit 1/Condensin-2 complex subunit D3 [Lupinus albus]|uniref:Putative condensin subunit 1/Condensin-2 complex subunit D3 n=1 Tax=Lupinus albus TaxID=3870 RepID=A0A6A4QG73_LUPAL|nr:putative condensin subunit 1/Condensin-2 complex subunit D3 [Lupinus albus]
MGFGLPGNIWYAATDKAIAAIYAIHPTPETIAADMIKKSFSSVFNDGSGDMQSDNDTSSCSIPATVEVAKLSRCLFVISHIAMNQLVYVECCARKIQKQKLAKRKRRFRIRDNDINAELGFAASEDAALDALFEKAEKEIVSGGSNDKNLIGICATFVSKLCRNFRLMQKIWILAVNKETLKVKILSSSYRIMSCIKLTKGVANTLLFYQRHLSAHHISHSL